MGTMTKQVVMYCIYVLLTNSQSPKPLGRKESVSDVAWNVYILEKQSVQGIAQEFVSYMYIHIHTNVHMHVHTYICTVHTYMSHTTL